MKKVIDYFPDYLNSDSLFAKMPQLGAPWSADVGENMDVAYFTMYSGIKNPSGFLELNSTDSVANSEVIAKVLYSMYGINWKRLWEAFTSEYNPIDNYNIKETVIRGETDDRSIDKDTTRDITDNGEDTTTTSENDSQNSTRNDYTYGFNSTEQTPTGVATEVTSNNISGTDKTVSSDTTNEVGTEKTTDKSYINENIERSRAGNVGQNSYQELLKQEFELWKWNFFTAVFDDADKFLALSIHVC